MDAKTKIQVEGLLQQAEREHQHGNLSGAAVTAQRILELDPGNTEADRYVMQPPQPVSPLPQLDPDGRNPRRASGNGQSYLLLSAFWVLSLYGVFYTYSFARVHGWSAHLAADHYSPYGRSRMSFDHPVEVFFIGAVALSIFFPIVLLVGYLIDKQKL